MTHNKPPQAASPAVLPPLRQKRRELTKHEGGGGYARGRHISLGGWYLELRFDVHTNDVRAKL